MILLIISAIAKGFCDRIRFKANFKSDWMIGAGKYVWYKRTWLMKYPLSFFSNGWHFFETVKILCLCIAITLWYELAWWFIIVFYIAHGIIFELTYRIK